MTKSERFKEEYDNTLSTLAKTKVKINLIEANVKKEDLPKCPEYSRLQQKYEEYFAIFMSLLYIQNPKKKVFEVVSEYIGKNLYKDIEKIEENLRDNGAFNKNLN